MCSALSAVPQHLRSQWICNCLRGPWGVHTPALSPSPNPEGGSSYQTPLLSPSSMICFRSFPRGYLHQSRMYATGLHDQNGALRCKRSIPFIRGLSTKKAHFYVYSIATYASSSFLIREIPTSKILPPPALLASPSLPLAQTPLLVHIPMQHLHGPLHRPLPAA